MTIANGLDLRCQDQLIRTKSRHVAIRYKMRIRVVSLVADVISFGPEVIHLSECLGGCIVSSRMLGKKHDKSSHIPSFLAEAETDLGQAASVVPGLCDTTPDYIPVHSASD